MGRLLLSAVLMLRDEAGSVAALVRSLQGIVDGIVLVDTGSTDDTVAVAERVAAECGVPIVVHCWSDGAISVTRSFADSRNGSLALHDAEPDAAVFTLHLSGDETVAEGSGLRAFLESKRDVIEEKAYSVRMTAGSASWPYPRVFRTGGGWKYVGRVHELPVAPGGETAAPPCPLTVVHTVSDPVRRSRRIREFDLPVLTEIVADESHTLAERARAMYFLADSHAAVGAEYSPDEPGGHWLTHMMTAMSLYWRCGQLMEASESPAHDHQKAIFAYFFYLHIADKIGAPMMFSPEELRARADMLVDADPEQPEARFLAAKCAAQVDPREGLHLGEVASRVARAAREGQSRHVPTDARIEWMALHIAAACAKALENGKRARELAERALAAGGPRESFAEFLSALP